MNAKIPKKDEQNKLPDPLIGLDPNLPEVRASLDFFSRYNLKSSIDFIFTCFEYFPFEAANRKYFLALNSIGSYFNFIDMYKDNKKDVQDYLQSIFLDDQLIKIDACNLLLKKIDTKQYDTEPNPFFLINLQMALYKGLLLEKGNDKLLEQIENGLKPPTKGKDIQE